MRAGEAVEVETCRHIDLADLTGCSTSPHDTEIMDKIKSDGIQRSRNIAFCNHVAMYLLLSFSICIPVALGSGGGTYLEAEGGNPSGSPSGNPASAPVPNPLFPPRDERSPPAPPMGQNLPPPLSLLPTATPTPAPNDLVRPISPPSSDNPPAENSPPAPSPFPDTQPSPLPPPPSPPPEVLFPGPPMTVNTRNESEKAESEKAGFVIASLAAVLQVAVVTYLLIKRHQMLAMVDEYDGYDNPDSIYGHPESV